VHGVEETSLLSVEVQDQRADDQKDNDLLSAACQDPERKALPGQPCFEEASDTAAALLTEKRPDVPKAPSAALTHRQDRGGVKGEQRRGHEG
jgi:hypothetical protein